MSRVFRTFDVPPEARPILRGIRETRDRSKAAGALCLLTDRIDSAFLDRMPKLRILSQMAVGYENIDVGAATRRGILVTNTPGILTETTADLAFALLLACARGVVRWDRHLRLGGFSGWEPFGYLGHDIHGASLGLVGRGRIGRAVARRARGFGMKVVFATRRGGLDRVLDCDFVSIHCPLTAETRHLIGRAELRRMKRTAYLVNTARGPIVEERALVKALRQGWIAGAGLDVYEREPEVHRGLMKLENVILLPHLASASVATRHGMLRTAVENLKAGLAGRRPRNLVNPAAWIR